MADLEQALATGGPMPRELMPQIEPEAYADLIEYARLSDVDVSFEYIRPEALSFHQDVNAARACAIPREALRIPILIAEDGSVLDGNHRAYAHRQRGEYAHVIRFHLGFEEAIEFLCNFNGVDYGYPLVGCKQ